LEAMLHPGLSTGYRVVYILSFNANAVVSRVAEVVDCRVEGSSDCGIESCRTNDGRDCFRSYASEYIE